MARSPEGAGLGRAVMRHWFLTLVLVVLGALGGAALARTQAPTYTAEERLAVGGGDLAAQAVPGFALASQELASNYARFVTAGPVRSKLPAATARRVLTIAASPVPESNVIRIEATATDPAAATAAAAEAGTQLVAQVDAMLSQQNGEQVRKEYRQMSQQVAEAQQAQADAQDVVSRYREQAQSGRAAVAAAARGALPAAKAEWVRASAQLADLQMQQTALAALYQNQVSRGPSQNNLAVVSGAAVSGDDVKSRLELYGLGGAAAGGVLSLALVAAAERRRPAGGRRAARGDLGSIRPSDGLPAEALLQNRHAPSHEDAEALLRNRHAPSHEDAEALLRNRHTPSHEDPESAYPPGRGWAGRGEHAAPADTADNWDLVDVEGRPAWTMRR